ncbi:hypothetical protein [Streptomyces sp. NPDC059491]|uniref:hypothetical protein n=1 Tax=Streptomyces sp. NPDC059491 TaxID=3346850 RepID=UPI00368D002C
MSGLSAQQTVMLDGALHAIGSDPGAVTPHATASALRDYRRGGVRVIFFATALGSILIVTYVEVD